jgi:glutamine amidotransferase
MQLLADMGEEHGSTKGLALLAGRVVALDGSAGERVPNIGWCEVSARQGSRLMVGVPGNETFYFVHGYHFVCADPAHVSATLRFGGKDIAAAVEAGNIFGVQFHPEKSQDAGIQLIERFLRF